MGGNMSGEEGSFLDLFFLPESSLEEEEEEEELLELEECLFLLFFFFFFFSDCVPFWRDLLKIVSRIFTATFRSSFSFLSPPSLPSLTLFLPLSAGC